MRILFKRIRYVLVSALFETALCEVLLYTSKMYFYLDIKENSHNQEIASILRDQMKFVFSGSFSLFLVTQKSSNDAVLRYRDETNLFYDYRSSGIYRNDGSA